jgi:ankyrin repeat protein
MKIYNKKTIKNIIFAGCLFAGSFGGSELLYGGWNPIHKAVYRGNMAELEDVIARGEAVHYLEGRDENGRTPLRLAVDLGNIPMIRALLRAGADREAPDSTGKTVLIIAIEMEHPLEIIEILVRAGANVNAFCQVKEPPLTPLVAAIERGDSQIIKLLIQFGANVNNNPLEVAIRSINLAAVKMLLEAGAHVYYYPKNPNDYCQRIIWERWGRYNASPPPEKKREMHAITDLVQVKYIEQHGSASS